MSEEVELGARAGSEGGNRMFSWLKRALSTYWGSVMDVVAS